MGLCSKGIARAKVRASNGKPSILYNALVSRFESRDAALKYYAKAMSDNFHKLTEGVAYERDANGEPDVDYVIQLIDNNRQLAYEETKTGVKETSSYGWANQERNLSEDQTFTINDNADEFDDLFDKLATEASNGNGQTVVVDTEKANTTKRKAKPRPRPKDEAVSAEALLVDDDTDVTDNNLERMGIYKNALLRIRETIDTKRSERKAKLRQLIANPDAADKTALIELNREIKELDKNADFYTAKINNLNQVLLSKDLFNDVQKQLTYIDTQLNNPDITLSQLSKFDSPLKVWANAKSNFVIEDDEQEVIDNIGMIANKADTILQKYIKIQNKLQSGRTLELSNDPTLLKRDEDSEGGLAFDVLGELENNKDVNLIRGTTMPIDRVGNKALQILSKTIRIGEARMMKRTNGFNKKVDAITKDIKDFDVFAETYEDGTVTGMMTHYIAPEFREEEAIHAERIKAMVHDAVDKFVSKTKFIHDKKIVLDPRILFADKVDSNGELVYKGVLNNGNLHHKSVTDADKQAHIDSVIEALGGDEFAKEEFEVLKTRLENMVDGYIATLEGYMIDKPDASDARETARFEKDIAKFVALQSPYVAAFNIENKVPIMVNDNTYRMNELINLLPAVPRRYKMDGYGRNTNEETGYYSKNFKKIINDANLKRFYRFYTDRVHYLDSILPAHLKLNNNGDNYVAMLDKSFFDLVNTKGVDFGKEANEELVKLVSRHRPSTANINPYTGRTEYRLSVPIINIAETEIQTEFAKAKLLEENRVKRALEIEEEFELRRRVIANLSIRKSFNLRDVLKVFNYQIENYMHKVAVEDSLTAIRNIVETASESKTNRRGAKVRLSTDKSYLNLKKQLDYYTEVFYGYDKSAEANGAKILSSKDKDFKAELDRMRVELEEEYQNPNSGLSLDGYQQRLIRLMDMEASLGRNVSSDQILRSVLKYTQLKGMGYNYGAALTNLVQGYISNSIEASDGRIFNKAQLMRAYGIMGGSVMSFWTRQHLSTEAATKIHNLARDYDIVGEVSSELQFNKNKEGGILSNVYVFSNSTEYLNQSPVIIATMLNTKLKHIFEGEEVEINLWDALDKDGNLRTDLEIVDRKDWDVLDNNPNSGIKFLQTITKITQAVNAVHGNYNKNTPTLMNSTAVLASMKQFKTWIFESVAQRIDPEEHDEILGMRRKGRWRTGFGIITYAKPKNYEEPSVNAALIAKNTLYTCGQLARQFMFLKTNLDSRYSEVDAANIRKNITTTITTMKLMVLAYAATAMLKAYDDDDELAKNVARYNINVANRLIDDLQMYYEPQALQNIAGNVVPALSLLTDIINLTKGMYQLGVGKVTETGVYAGELEGIRNIMKSLPFLSKIHTTRAMSVQVMNTVR